jgi:hypothetical protein
MGMNTGGHKNISVEKAIKRGEQLLINGPIYAAILSILGIVYLWRTDPLDIPTAIVGTIVLVLAPVVYWSVSVTQWRIWAFSRVRNVNELKKLAIKESIIVKEGHWAEKMEFRTPYQRELLRELEGRLKQKDDTDYKDIYPASLSIGFSKAKLGMGLFYTAIFGAVGLFMLYDENWFGAALLAIGLYFGWGEVRKLKKKDDQLRFDNKGVFSAEYGFVPWNRVSGAHVLTIEGKHETSSLIYERLDKDIAIEDMQNELSPEEANALIEEWKQSNTDRTEEDSGENLDETEDLDEEENAGAEESINIDELDIDAAEVRKILKVYRSRYIQSLSKNK